MLQFTPQWYDLFVHDAYDSASCSGIAAMFDELLSSSGSGNNATVTNNSGSVLDMVDIPSNIGNRVSRGLREARLCVDEVPLEVRSGSFDCIRKK